MRYLIRHAETKFDDWFNGKGAENPQSLTDSVFRLTKALRPQFKGLWEDSTYQVESHLEEVMVGSAHLLTGNKPVMKARYLIRILPRDLEEAGLEEDDFSIGETGVPWVDFRHRDLVGTKEQFRQLVEVILHRTQRGDDRIRRIGPAQDIFSLNQFLALSAAEMPTCTRDLIKCLLNGTPIAVLNPVIVLAKTEIANLAIPRESIALRAHCLVEAARGSGSDDATWDEALNQLREEYRRQYPHAQVWP